MTDGDIGVQEFPCGATQTCKVSSFRRYQDERHRLTVITYDPDRPDVVRPTLGGAPAPCLACPTPAMRHQASTYTEAEGFAENGWIQCSSKIQGDPDLAPPRRVVIYHDACADGAVAAWAVHEAWGDEALYIPLRVGAEVPWADCADADVAIVDFSFSRDDMERLAVVARRVVLLDHHRTAAANLAGLPYCHVDTEASGASMAWRHFHRNEKRPWIVKYVEDGDLWRFKLDGSREVNAWLGVQEPTVEAMGAVAEAGLGPAKRAGTVVLRAMERYVEAVVGEAQVATLGGFVVPIVNVPRPYVSEVLNRLCEGVPFAAAWHVLCDGRVKYSLRSTPGSEDAVHDVSRVAELFAGGGGHRHAASFIADRIVHEAPGVTATPTRRDVLQARKLARRGTLHRAWVAPRVVSVEPREVAVTIDVGAVHSAAGGIDEREAVGVTADRADPPWRAMKPAGEE